VGQFAQIFGVRRFDAAFFLFFFGISKKQKKEGRKESGVKPPHSKVTHHSKKERIQSGIEFATLINCHYFLPEPWKEKRACTIAIPHL